MAITWIIIEDDFERGKTYVSVLKETLHKEVDIIWLAANYQASRVIKPSVVKHKGIFEGVCIEYVEKNMDRVYARLEGIQGDAICLLDLDLGVLHDPDLNDGLLNPVRHFLANNTGRRLVTLTSTATNVHVQKDLVGAAFAPQIVTGKWNMSPKEKLGPARQIIDHSLRKWKVLTGGDLGAMWETTKNWFHKDDEMYETGLLPHNLGGPQNQNVKGKTEKDNHQAIVKAVPAFSWFPDAWWDTPESMYNVHNALKLMCGYSYKSGDYNLGVGSIFILAGMACEEAGIKNAFKEITDWGPFTDCDVAVLPPQPIEIAKECCQNLYSFFLMAFVEDKAPDDLGVCTIEEIDWTEPGSTLRIQMWDAHKAGTNIQQQIERLLATPKDSENGQEQKKEPKEKPLWDNSHTISPLLRFFLLSNIRLGGFGMEETGGISMSRRVLTIKGTRKQKK